MHGVATVPPPAHISGWTNGTTGWLPSHGACPGSRYRSETPGAAVISSCGAICCVAHLAIGSMHQPEPPDGAVPCWQLVFLMAIGPILFFVTGSLLDDNERLLVIGGGGKRKRKAHLVDASTATVEDAVVLPSGSLQMGPCSWCGKTEPYPKPKKPKYLKQYMRDLLAKFQGLHSNCQPIAAAVRAKRP